MGYRGHLLHTSGCSSSCLISESLIELADAAFITTAACITESLAESASPASSVSHWLSQRSKMDLGQTSCFICTTVISLSICQYYAQSCTLLITVTLSLFDLCNSCVVIVT